MTRTKHPAHKKKKRPRASAKKMNAIRHQFDQIIQSSEDSALRTPLPLIVIATYLNRLDFKASINRYVQWDTTQWKYSPGVLAQLLVIATFIPATKKVALSRIPQAYSGMDLELLVGEPVNPADLSDDLFANMLDRLWEAGCENILSTIALTVRTVFDLPPDYILHSDTTSHVLYGDYDSSEYASDPSRVRPAYGYSKDKRDDLKQIMTGMTTDGDGLIRFCHILDGNTADCEYNRMMIKTLQEIYGDEFYRYTYIADSKLLNKKNLELISCDAKPVKIISRIPENFAGKLVEKIRIKAYENPEWQDLGICCEHPTGKGKEPKYWVQTYKRDVFGFPVWIHIYKSGDAERRLQEKIKKAREVYEADLKVLTEKGFACEPDAIADLEAFIKSHSKTFLSANLSVVASINERNPVGRPSKTPKPKQIAVTWGVRAGPIIQNEARIEQQRRKNESFCLLTNIDPDTLGSKDILLRYKAQHKVEHNFSVLKMPLLASTLFLERPERIEAMMTLLYFSVLMHGILQLISRTRIAACKEAPPLGPQNRPLIRPMSETMLNVLALFEIISKGDAVSIRSKMPERRTQLDLILFLVDFNPKSI
ncbi:MAG: IS1634 family transposase [Methanothrix sp.]|nr:MAG: IS1634 family transposase [Methanothrix sp.]